MAAVKNERLFNLVVALLETRRPLTFADIRRRTREYQQGDSETGRRQFERDKDDLRRLGVPIETTDVEFGTEQGYRIDRRRYEMPDVDLTPAEVAALALAVRLGGDDEHRLAFAKLSARAPDPADLDADGRHRVADGAPRVEVATDLLDAALAEALSTRTTITFAYRDATGGRTARRVDPYAVRMRRGAWYLVAHDHGRDALRAFRLDRIDGTIRPFDEAGAFEVPDDLDVDRAIAGPEAERVDVEIAVESSARWSVSLRGATPTGRTVGEREVLTVPGLDPGRDRSWLLGLGAAVEVLSPPELRAEVAAAHRRIATRHGAGDDVATGGDAA